MRYFILVLLSIFANPAAAVARWTPVASDTWQWQISQIVDTRYDVKIYDIDMVDVPKATFDALHARNIKVLCYFSAGSAENFRADYSKFKPADLGSPLSGWPGERWVDTRSANVRAIMRERLDFAAAKGCDGVEPDNVDAYTNKPGLPLTAATQLDYNRFLANEAHARGLAVALKNDIGQLAALEPYFDLAVNEQCNQYNECSGYSVFTRANKPVLNAEYASKYRANTNGARDKLCAASRAANIRTLVLPLALNNILRFSCD